MVAFINASIAQGSIVGPPHNVVVASDLQPIRQHNQLMKYADDTHVLVASGYIVTAQEKFRIRLIKAT